MKDLFVPFLCQHLLTLCLKGTLYTNSSFPREKKSFEHLYLVLRYLEVIVKTNNMFEICIKFGHLEYAEK